MAGSIGTDPFGLRAALKEGQTDDKTGGSDPYGLRDALKKKDQSKYALPTGADYSENGGVADQASHDTNPTGFRTVTPGPTIPVHNKPIDDTNEDAEVERMQKQQADAQAQYDKEHPDTGTWSNAFPTLFHATLGVVTKGVAATANIARDIGGIVQPSDHNENNNDSSQPLYKEDPWGQSTGELTDYGKQVDAKNNKDYLGRLVLGLDAYNNETAKADYEKHLPKTFLGNTASGLINIAPIAATATLFPEGELAEGAEATSVNVAALQKLKNIAVNPFTKVSAIQGGLNAYDEAKQKGESPGEALLEGAKGAATEGGQAAVYNILGHVGGEFLSPKIAESLTNSGILKNGKLTRIGTDTTADAIVFSAYPIASNLIQGKPVDWNEVEQGLGTGLAFGGMKGVHTYGDFSEADDQLKQTGDAVAMKNFYDASPQAIQEAFKLPDSSVDLNAKAVDFAAQAKKETDLNKRQQLIAASSMYQKLSDVKNVTQAVLGDPTGFVDNINNATDLTDEQRSGLISKIRSVPDMVNQVEKADPIHNFASASPEDLVTAMQRPEDAGTLQAQAHAKAMEFQNATDPTQQEAIAAEQTQLQQHADIKTIADTVINHGIDPFIEAVNNSDLPDDVKSTLISKAHAVNNEFNPVIQKEVENKAAVADLTDKIDTLQNTPGATDPVNNPTGVANLIDLVEQRTDKQVELLDKAIDNPEHIPALDHEQEKEKETETAAIPGTGVPANTDSNGLLEGGFQFKSKDHGILNIVPEEKGEYTVHFGDGTSFKGTPEDIKLAVPDFDESKIGAPEDVQTLHGTDNPNEVARLYDDKVRELKDTGSIEGAIADYNPSTDKETFGRVDDPNNLTKQIARNYFRDKGERPIGLDLQADEINRLYFNGAERVTPQDIADFMKKYPSGARSYSTAKGNPELAEIAQRYTDMTGKPLTNAVARDLAAKYNNVSAKEIRDAESHLDSAENTEKIKRFIDQELSKPGLHEIDTVIEGLEKEFDRYLSDSSNEFNPFHELFGGDILSEDDIKLVRDEIEQTKTEQLPGDTGSEEPAAEDSGAETFGKEGERAATIEPASVEEDDLPFQRGKGETIPPERAEKIQGLMKKVFPNVETIFHPTVADFAEAAKANGIDSLPNAFIDKSGTIHFNPESLHADTQIHEYGHILTKWAKENAPTLYNRMIAFGRDAKDIHQELKNNGYNLAGNRLHEEAFVTMLGRHGEGKLDEVIKNSGTRGTVSKFINDLWTRFQRYIADKTGFDLARFKNIKDMPINEFLDHVNSKYLLSDTKVSDIGTKEYADVEQQKPQKPMREEGESMADYFKRVIDWTKEQQKPAEELKDPEGAQFTLEQDKLKPGYNFSETSIKNRVVAEERRARFLDEVDVTAKRDFGDVWQRAKEIVDNDKNNPANTTGNQKYLPVQLAEDIIKKPRPLTAEETGILLYGRMQLYNDHRATMDNIADAVESGNTAMEAQERVRLSIIENNIENNDIAAKRAGYEQGLGLAARRMIAAQDYSLANQLQLAKIANGGKELPAVVRMKLETLTKQLEDAQRKLADYQTNAAAKAAAVSLARLKKEAEAEQRAERNQKRSQSQDQIKKNIENIKSSILDKLRKNKGTTSTILPYADKLAEITPDLAKLAKEYIKSGIVTIEGIVDAVHDFIKDDLDGVTKRDIRDALSGYGKTNKPSKETIEAQLRELKAQMRLTSALEDAQAGENPLKSGYIHAEPSEKVRELQKQVRDAMRLNGIEEPKSPVSEEDAWKSALDSVKTRLRNQIEDLNKQIETGIKPEAKGRVIYDQEANDLKAERDRLKEAIDQTEGNKELTDEQRVEILTKTTEKSINEYKERIDELKNTGKDSIGDERRAKQDALKNLIESTPDLKIARERLKALQDEHAKIIEDAKPKRTDEEIKLDAFKKRKVKEIAELENLLEKGKTDPSVFGKVPEKPSLILDDYSKHLQSESNGLKRKIDAERQKLKIKNMPWLSKTFFKGSKFVRFALLSRPTTLFKLGAAAAMRITLSPLEEVVGGGLSLIPGLNKVSAKAPREGGGFNFEAESKALASVLSKKTYQEAWRTAKQGKSELDDRMDDAGQKAFNEDGILAIPGHIHAAEKTIPKINEYNRSLHKRIDFALRNGYDITNPDTQTAIQINTFKENNPDLFYTKLTDFKDIDKKAFDDAKRAIFQQPNYISEAWNMALKNMEAKGSKAELFASVLRIFLPITKVPTNYASEGLSYALGGFKAGAQLFKGIDKLTPDEADMVMRLFKKQGIGAAFFGLGWLLRNYIGGYYNSNDSQEKKRKSDSPGPDEIKIDDTTMPHWLLHAPLLETMQMGATAGRIHDNYHHNNKESTLDEVGQNAFVSGKGLLEKVPFVSGPSDLNRGTENTSTTTKYISNFILSRVNVLGVLDIAQALDTDSHGKPIKRKTAGFGDEIMSHIPGEREELPKKK